ncbi:MAG TPA: toll/interleukin-1 receptor domain-containing protein [Chthoniobacterales bacterium]|nr:toll/interleukin-1 receptor domain-containing protein [Chthoniobacterales bacterium]
MPHDFFLSYACLDNEPAIPGRPESAWVTTFSEALCGRLQFYLQREANPFFDTGDVSGVSALTPKIEGGIDGSHVFVAISSPTYYARPWCKLERDRFIKRLGPNPVIAERVFVIHMTDVDPLIQPLTWQGEFFPDLKGYYFFREGSDRRLNTLGFPALDVPIADQNSYYIEINRLAEDMAKRIRALENAVAPQPVVEVLEARDEVFLAENALRSHADREELRVALEERGFEVRPATSLANKPAAELAAAMSSALAFVQIISPVLLEIAGAAGATYDEVQLQAAGTLPTFRWRAPDLDMAAAAANYPGFRKFAEAPDVRTNLLPTFKMDLLAELESLRAGRRVQQAKQGNEPIVLITGEPADLAAHAVALGQQLNNRALGHFVTATPASELEAPDVRGFLMLYGDSTPEKIRDRLRIVRTLAKTRLSDLRVGVYFCPPPPDMSGRQLLFDMPSFRKIRWDDGPSLDAFANAVTQ